MKVNFISSNNNPYFGKLRYRNRELVERAIASKPEIKECLKQAEKDLENTDHEMVVYSNDGYLCSHYVDLGKGLSLTYIDEAKTSESSLNTLEVVGFVYDVDTGYKSIEYNECEIKFKDPTVAKKYEEAINACDDENRDVACIKRAVLVTKALDEE